MKTPLIFILALCASFSQISAQCSSTTLKNQIVENAVPVANMGFEATDYSCVSLSDDATHTFSLELRSGTRYAVVGGCDGDCKDIDFYLYDENGNEVDKDTLDDDDPVVDITPSWSGTFYLKLKMCTCNVSPCGAGIVLLEK